MKSKPQLKPFWVELMEKQIQTLIETNSEVSLTNISKGLNLNPSYVSRIFPKYFNNCTFKMHVNRLRLAYAIKLLEQNEILIHDIAIQTGFSDPSHFSRIFKKTLGKTPSEFRNKYQQKKLE